MSRPLDVANREIERVRALPYGAARTAAAEQQVRLVEAEGPDGARAWALLVLVESYVWAGEVRRAYLPFTQVVRWYDEHPEHVDETDRQLLFWSFKWMVGHLADFPDVPAEQIEATLADMERRYALAGLGYDAVAFERFVWARHRGAPDVDELFDTWVRTPRDDYSQCEACDPGDRASYLAARGDHDEARRLIEQTLEQDPRCATEPADMLSLLALLQLRAGDAQAAAATHRRAVAALAESESAMSGARGRRFRLLADGGQVTRALRALASDAHLLIEADTPAARFWFLTDVVHGTATLLPDHAGTPVRLDGVPVTDVAGLHAWAAEEAAALARDFDARNGTDRFARALKVARSARSGGVRLDLDVLPVGGALAGAGAPGVTHVDAPVVPPAATSLADPAGVGGLLPDETPLERAERLTAAGELVAAAHAWLALASQADAEGRLADAGLALAEAARCAQEEGDEDGAAATYPEAVARMRAGGAPGVQIVAVLLAWAPVAAATGTADQALQVADEVLTALDAAPATAQLPSTDPAALPTAGAGLDERLSAERRRARADLLDTAARLLASLGRGPEAVRRASSAAEGYAGIGAVVDSAHAFWLAGRLLADQGEIDDAVWHLESAVEGFTAARRRDERGAAASALVDVLRGAGRDDQADEVARTLTR